MASRRQYRLHLGWKGIFSQIIWWLVLDTFGAVDTKEEKAQETWRLEGQGHSSLPLSVQSPQGTLLDLPFKDPSLRPQSHEEPVGWSSLKAC